MGSMTKALSTGNMIKTLREQESDFEWYPTTTKQIELIKSDLKSFAAMRESDSIYLSVLDCGCGDGRVLSQLTDGKKFGIEKALPLIQALPSDVFIVGTDFHQQQLIDKKIDVIFSNPPYSDYKAWMTKIITEANAQVAYFIVPQRWADCEQIQGTLEARRAKATIVASSDFLNADRKARAIVDIVRVNFTGRRASYHWDNNRVSVDPFKLWFDSAFAIKANQTKVSDYETKAGISRRVTDVVTGNAEIVKQEGLVKVLERFYQRDMEHLMSNYKKIAELDAALLSEMNVNVRAVQESLQLKIKSLKDSYWRELINNLSEVTDKLCSSSRTALLDTLFDHTHVDFTAQNAHSIVLWVLKNANVYLDSQLIELVEDMVNPESIVLYKSNSKTFGKEQWRWNSRPQDLDRYALDYRVVVPRKGGICVSSWSHERTDHGLEARATTFLGDIQTVAQSLGFDCTGHPRAEHMKWESRKKQEFHYVDVATGREKLLMDVRAYQNGNLHIRFCPEFLIKLNVRFGQLKGWLRTPKEASDELNVSEKQAVNAFNVNYKLALSSCQTLIGKAA